MFIAALFIITKCEQPTYPLSDRWVNKMLYIHAVEYYLVLKRKVTLSRAVM